MLNTSSQPRIYNLEANDEEIYSKVAWKLTSNSFLLEKETLVGGGQSGRIVSGVRVYKRFPCMRVHLFSPDQGSREGVSTHGPYGHQIVYRENNHRA
ncbi:uncharacterized protein VTP21DRAFT_3867 [Calcarisporiella thermophila]|uniref:uncharacterized protein n=1 Tax=Calcarisporiella thermophila TaxID=911321 RepID=UPI0037435B02